VSEPLTINLSRTQMIRRYDFKCLNCSHVEEHWTESDQRFVTCLECGETAQRIISPISTKFEGFGWPDADDKWARDHERAAKK
jgi:predicted nucleic acid-binding Zn ribbon protein